MSRWPRRMTALFLAAMLTAGVSCTSSDSLGPSEPAAPEMAGTDQDALLLGDLLKSLSDLRLLGCSTQPYVSVTKVVGTAGGTIVVGTHTLVIPAKPAKLTMSYGNCSPLLVLKRVVYTDELLRILELIPSLDNLRTKTVTGDIRHFSRYAVAW
jgi:hypothetical protein